jgi:hypothetical protein
MTDQFRQQVGVYQQRLDRLVGHGRELARRLTDDPMGADGQALMRAWQHECAATINQLSGGSKAHWLSRAYGDAFLVVPEDARGAPAAASEVGAPVIVERILSVLTEAQASLAAMVRSGEPGAPRARSPHFGFVQDGRLRPRLEQAFDAAQDALDHGRYALAVVTWASLLEAVLADALDRRTGSTGTGVPAAGANCTLDSRIRAAERARLISAACARLPDVARRYRDLLDASGQVRGDVAVSEQEARLTGQVLRVVARDLAPGR